MLQVSVAEEYGGKLRTYPDIMEPAAYGDSTKEWTHLVLTKVSILIVLLLVHQPKGHRAYATTQEGARLPAIALALIL